MTVLNNIYWNSSPSHTKYPFYPHPHPIILTLHSAPHGVYVKFIYVWSHTFYLDCLHIEPGRTFIAENDLWKQNHRRCWRNCENIYTSRQSSHHRFMVHSHGCPCVELGLYYVRCNLVEQSTKWGGVCSTTEYFQKKIGQVLGTPLLFFGSERVCTETASEQSTGHSGLTSNAEEEGFKVSRLLSAKNLLADIRLQWAWERFLASSLIGYDTVVCPSACDQVYCG